MEIRENVKRKLIKIAKKDETINYGEIMNEFGIPRGNPKKGIGIGDVLGEISKSEVAEGKPMLSAIVVKKDGTKKIGDGFYPLARELGLLKSEDREEEVAFLHEQQVKVWKQYKK